ncbi:MAG: hypothetical protein HDR12_10765 [Lachnospiraceae bacterium]|nr:hypothetical protein [Lachnospiraceae bacterium]
MKAKIGISVGLLGAAVYFAALFGGYVPTIILTGYILLCEENEWLKKSAVKAVALMMSISFAIALISLVPDVFSWISSLVAIFKGTFNYGIVSLIISVITKAIDIVRTCLFLMLGVKALNQGTVAVPFVDKIINKYF